MGGARICLIVALNNWYGHVDRGGAWAPRVAILRKTTRSEQVKTGMGGDPRDCRERTSKKWRRVDNGSRWELMLNHVE